MEMNFYAPIFTGEARDDSWQTILGRDYTAPRHHISFVRAAGRRLRRNYVWILAVQVIAYYGKIAIIDACVDLGGICRSRRRWTDSRLGRSEWALPTISAGWHLRSARLARPTQAPEPGRQVAMG